MTKWDHNGADQVFKLMLGKKYTLSIQMSSS